MSNPTAPTPAQSYYLHAEQQAAHLPDLPADIIPQTIASVGVIGAGTMGGGITMNFLNVGIPVVLVEMKQEALDRGINIIAKNYEKSAAKGRMTADEVAARMALITPALSLDALSGVDLIIEAVFEDMAVKKDVFSKLDRIAKPEALLASNTSFLDLNEIASATSRPENVLGLHFFSPANVMRLLEVVRGAKTSQRALASALNLARTIKKAPIVAGVCYGFIANRVMFQRSLEADKLVLEGPSPQEIDTAMAAFGFTMGPFAMIDLVGLDVIGRGVTERTLIGDFVKADRLGQKKNGGFYDYDENRNPSPSPVAAQIIADFAAYKGKSSKRSFSTDEIIARLLYAVVNEGAKCLEEGIALRASDIDVAAVLGYGWPVETGGPMYWADSVGLQTIVDGLIAQGHKPANLLAQKAASGSFFTR